MFGCSMALIDNMYVIIVAKFIFGLGVGGMTAYGPNFINETVPIEFKGPIGSFT